MVSIIMPALNEGATIAKVIQRIKPAGLVHEVIVVDDNSVDNTVEQALKEQARVVTSSKRGKGLSMREGMMAARYDTIVYLDADILTYPKNIVELLAQPILKDEADFVKSYFERQAGRVTQLVAKPLLSIFFPALEKFQQPLSGMIAAKKSFLNTVEFENDYGVDIALLIDAQQAGIRIKEVNIGYIKNNMQTLEALGKMSRQVSRTILQKAKFSPAENFETLANIHVIRDEMDSVILESMNRMQKMAIFEMDALLQADFLLYAAAANGWEKALIDIYTSGLDTMEQLKLIAKLFEGMSLPEVQHLLDSIPLVPDAKSTISALKKKGYICVLISGSFDVVAGHLKNRLGFDYSFANRLVMEKSIATGDIEIHKYFNTGNDEEFVFDKSAILDHLSDKMNIPVKNTIFIGNEEDDVSLLRAAGLGIVLSSASAGARKSADHIITENSLKPVLSLATALPGKKTFFNISVSKKKSIGIGAISALASIGVGLYLLKNGKFKLQKGLSVV